MCLGVDAETGGPKKSDCTTGVRTPLAVYAHKGFCYEVYSPCNVIIQFILVGKNATNSEIYMAVEHNVPMYCCFVHFVIFILKRFSKWFFI